MTEHRPLLTVAIPTWNRAAYMEMTLRQLRHEVRLVPVGNVEVLVSDNHSPDDTPAVVTNACADGLNITYLRNPENIGSDANIAQCFNRASGRYVLILGDDDLLVDGALALLLAKLAAREYGVVCLRAYGYDHDFRQEYPGGAGRDREFLDGGAFLAAIGQRVTLISSCVINKELLAGVDARDFCGGNLVQVHLNIRAALLAKHNLYVDRYLIACKRNNSGGYDFSAIFVRELGHILDRYQAFGLSAQAIRNFENHLLIGYYPFSLLRQRIAGTGDPAATLATFAARFQGRWLFHYWLAPVLRLPRALAIVWGGAITAIGRVLTNDFRRGILFAWNRFQGGKPFHWLAFRKKRAPR